MGKSRGMILCGRVSLNILMLLRKKTLLLPAAKQILRQSIPILRLLLEPFAELPLLWFRLAITISHLVLLLEVKIRSKPWVSMLQIIIYGWIWMQVFFIILNSLLSERKFTVLRDTVNILPGKI